MMGDVFSGDKFTGQGYTVNKAGRDINQVVSSHQVGSAAQLDAAVGELRALIDQLIRDRAVTPDGEAVADPAAVIAAVRDNPSRLQELGVAVAGGAKDAVLSIVQGGVAAMVVALLGR